MFKAAIAEELTTILQEQMRYDEVYNLIERPANANHGDYAFPTFRLAKIYKQPPQVIAENLKGDFTHPYVSHVEVVNGFLNFFLDKDKSGQQIVEYLLQGDANSTQLLKDETFVIDYSSPNIAKPFSMGHLRATVVGDSLARIFEANGAEVVRINHLGDWGTQFGKLIVAYQKWGDAQTVEKNPIIELFHLYTKFHEVSETEPTLEDEAREAFKALENGDSEYLALWQWFRDVSLEAFNHLYEQLGIQFDAIQGESFYNDKLDNTVKLLADKKLIKQDEGATIVEMKDLPPALIKKRDGASLYMTRDLAAVLYRQKTYQPTRIFYVVGQEQTVHFQQLRQLSQLLQLNLSIEHIPFGLILKDGKKMSTRQGKVVLLEDMLAEVEAAVYETLTEKNSNIEDKQATAKQIAIASVKFQDLKHDRTNSYDLNINEMLSFEGDTALYVMYTYARIQSILRKSVHGMTGAFQFDETMWSILNHLKAYEEVLEVAATHYTPSSICRYVLQLCRLFNNYYGVTRILNSTNEQSKVTLLHLVADKIEVAMALLGISLVEEI
ncbi:arginine--tRNA ligase [Staphylococcus americanisciuri]|uniref:Arginine--tRNA ligase n=1 Tax=Staphylococcus americanisciuri TaxID=2973940 RepID=A0ABT2EZX5_9STAP|nr:arginine--tRNA ligase [Staphylococcus americanisciuri]MCS4485752.1 arginine--tRNA ligase [Staphylococcus americanisciuri]